MQVLSKREKEIFEVWISLEEMREMGCHFQTNLLLYKTWEVCSFKAQPASLKDACYRIVTKKIKKGQILAISDGKQLSSFNKGSIIRSSGRILIDVSRLLLFHTVLVANEQEVRPRHKGDPAVPRASIKNKDSSTNVNG